MARVKHIREPKEPNDVYIGRPSKWGNPFAMGSLNSREDVIRLHATWLEQQPNLLRDLPELKGKNLVCYCAPLGCHGDTLLELANDNTE